METLVAAGAKVGDDWFTGRREIDEALRREPLYEEAVAIYRGQRTERLYEEANDLYVASNVPPAVANRRGNVKRSRRGRGFRRA